MVENLHFVKDLGYESQEALEDGDLRRVRGADERALGAQEAAQRRDEQPATSTSGTSWPWQNGALGGKLIGAGGGGFLMFYAEDKTRLRHAMARHRPARGALPLRLRGHEGRHPVTGGPRADDVPVAILAGGLATRLRPLTEAHAQGPGRGRGPAVHRPPARAAARGRACGGSCCASATWASRSRRTSATARARGLAVALLATTASACSAPAAPCGGRCRCWATLFLVLYGDSLPRHRLRAPCWRAFADRPAPGAHDRAAQRGPLGPEQRRSSRTAGSSRYDKRRAHAGDDATSTTAWRLLRRAALARIPAGDAVRPRRPLPRPGGRGAHGRLRGDAALLRDRLARGPGGDARHLAGSGDERDVLRRPVPGARPREILARLDAAADRAPGGARWPALRERGGRLFVLGVGGSAANASHAVNDFRKICGIEAYAPTDNVSELTARVNDDGWETVFADWLRGQPARRAKDMVLVFSVGGGDLERNISPNLVRALAVREGGRRHIVRRRRPRRRLHRAGGRRLRDRAAPSTRADRHAARRGVPGRGLAPAGLAPGAADGARRSGSRRR